MSHVRLRGIRSGNLKDLDLNLSHGEWTAIHGPSGSGKTALLFGALVPASRSRFRILENPAALPAEGDAQIQRIANSISGLLPVLSCRGEVPRKRGAVEIGSALDLWPLLWGAWTEERRRQCPSCGHRWKETQAEHLLEWVGSKAEGAPVRVYSEAGGRKPEELMQAGWTRGLIPEGPVRLEEAPTPLPPDSWLLIDRFRWQSDKEARLLLSAGESLRRGGSLRIQIGDAEHSLPAVDSCPACGEGQVGRENTSSSPAREDLVLGDDSLRAWCARPLEDWLEFPGKGAARRRVEALVSTRLGHLSASRTLSTLSLGEARRLELSSLLGTVRQGQLVVLDEPGMGLHGVEREALAQLLHGIKARGGTVLTADPSREFIEAADSWVELGPEGGPNGGCVVGQGRASDLPVYPPIPFVENLQPARRSLAFESLDARFLDIPSLELPLGRLVAIAGVSGSGKTTLVERELAERLRKGEGFSGELPVGGFSVLLERALGHGPRSTLATLSGAWTEIREAFADGMEARIRGLSPGDFVAQPRKGACKVCDGKALDGDGLPCPFCSGLGLRDDLLDLRLRERSLREWLQTPLSELQSRLPHGGLLRPRLEKLCRLGMGSRCLGERGRNLSLGERGRIALARRLAGAKAIRPRLFLLDEPCLGLPEGEAEKVLDLFRELVVEGHSFWVIEHHETLLRGADWLVELGPGAGPEGGHLLAEGFPSSFPECETPTGKWLKSRASRKVVEGPPRSPVLSPSRILSDDWSRKGLRALEGALSRELECRSPLVEDLPSIPGAAEEIPHGAPVAWPANPGPEIPLADILGLSPRLEKVFREGGIGTCRACGGEGPWPDLAVGLACAVLPTETLWFTSAPDFPGRKTEHSGSILSAAGYREILRGNDLRRLGAGERLKDGDLLVLDKFSPAAEAETGRWRDLARACQLLGGGDLAARFPDRPREIIQDWQDGACRDCGDRSAGVLLAIGGASLEMLMAGTPGDALDFLDAVQKRTSPSPSWLESIGSTSLWKRPLSTPWGSLSSLESRAARLSGWLLNPLEGVTLLHDQALAGFPAPLARSFAAALRDDPLGCHSWTDPEGFADVNEDGSCETAVIRELSLDPATWSRPKPAQGRDLLRDALGLGGAFRDQYLRTEEAGLRAWGQAHLGRGSGGKACSHCRGRGGVPAHPRLMSPCPECGGTGWKQECRLLQVRGLAWTDLPSSTLEELAHHFSETPAIADVLARALDCGMGGLFLDMEMRRLPRGASFLAPLLASEPGKETIRVGPILAGLSRLEAERVSSTMRGYLSAFPELEWWDTPQWPSTPSIALGRRSASDPSG